MVTALSPIIFLAMIALGPALLGLAIFLVSLAGRATWRLTLGLTVLAALVPAVGLPFLGQYVSAGDPISLAPFGRGSGFSTWVVPTLRVDTFALFAAVGVAYFIIPILLWLAFADHPRAPQALEEPPSDSTGPANREDNGPEQPRQHAEMEMATNEATGPQAEVSRTATAPAQRSFVHSVCLVLWLETAALTLIFADSLILLAIAWVVLAALAWGQGELSSELGTADRVGFAAMTLGPLLWLAFVLLPATSARSASLLELTGRTAISPLQCILLALAIALAGGAYPFLAWVHRRAALATPVGLAAVLLTVLPAATYVATRTYAIAIDANNRWPLFGPAPRASAGPAPVTAGIAFAVLGAATVLICGLLALSRRDGRMLLALLGTSQVGWGMVGLGSGEPTAVIGVTLLLPTAVLGLGAMLTALMAGGALTREDEPDACGPCPVREPLRPLALAAWSIGGLTLIGAPLLAGFAPRHLISAASLQTSGLLVPLSGLCWVGDALFVLALLRATAPALTGAASRHFARSDGRDLVATVLALLALGIGIVPAVVIGQWSTPAADALVAPRSLATVIAISPAGYATDTAQWLPGIAWLIIVVTAILLVAVRPHAGRRLVPVYRAGGHETSSALPATISKMDAPLLEPHVAWDDLRGAFDSPFTVPGGEWLVVGLDDDDEHRSDEPAAHETATDSVEGEPVAATVEEMTHGTE